MKINPPLFELEASSKQQDIRRPSPDNDMDVSIHVDNASLIEMAMQIPQTDPQLITRARVAILSDQLETPENFFLAAEDIEKFSI